MDLLIFNGICKLDNFVLKADKRTILAMHLEDVSKLRFVLFYNIGS